METYLKKVLSWQFSFKWLFLLELSIDFCLVIRSTFQQKLLTRSLGACWGVVPRLQVGGPLSLLNFVFHALWALRLFFQNFSSRFDTYGTMIPFLVLEILPSGFFVTELRRNWLFQLLDVAVSAHLQMQHVFPQLLWHNRQENSMHLYPPQIIPTICSNQFGLLPSHQPLDP